MAKKTKKSDHSAAEQQAKVLELDREIFNLRNELAVNRKLEKPHLIKAKRKEKARILTAMTQTQCSKGVA
jgi:large subunit ribosomal protein L29